MPGLHSPILNRRTLLRSALWLGAAATVPAVAAELAAINDRMSGDFWPVHDPCVIRSGDVYHLFCTSQLKDGPGLLPWRTSRDLVTWERRGSVFETLPEWAQRAIPGTGGLWAPDIAWFNGAFHLYYSVSTFGSNRSAIGLVKTASLDPASPQFGWHDQGLAIESNRGDDFNAIDANHIVDRDGKHWLVLGSFWTGIKLFPLDPATGKPRPGDTRRHSIASRPVPDKAPGAVEAPFLIERDGYYYLFVSFDYCCRGASSSYYMVVGRSKKITGPYVGRDGRKMTDGYGTVLLQGNRHFRGPGHNAILRDGDQDYLVYHAYDTQHDGRPTLRISPIVWSDGWPTVSL
jgi:arabinan endo-1,5-alpha-L-arabinosidase